MGLVAKLAGSMSSNHRVVFGSAGLGGYAAGVCLSLKDIASREDGCVSYTAVCEPDQERHEATIAELRAAGIRVHRDIDELLAEPVEAVWLPLPIHLHASYTVRALQAGKAVICEKPAAGSVEDVDAMIAARDLAGLPVTIGYQDIHDPVTLAAKRKLLEGIIGKPQTAYVRACWPRGHRYYNRSNWAGALKREDVWVLDSPANNAMAHYITLMLFLIGESETMPAAPTSVEAELYRVHPIENFDTCTLRVKTQSGCVAQVFYTHASKEAIGPVIEIRGEKGTVVWTGADGFTFHVHGESSPRLMPSSPRNRLRENILARFCDELRGVRNTQSVLATLEVSRAQTVVVNGASEAGHIHNVPKQFVTPYEHNEDRFLAIENIESMFERCSKENKMLHETGLAPWSSAAGVCDLRNYRKFAGPKR